MEERTVIGVDIGTTKVAAIVAAADEINRINVLGVGNSPSEGLNRGVVVNIDKTVDAVLSAIREAERVGGVRAHEVVVGIAGDHIQSFQSRGVITSRNGEISQADVDRLLEDTRHVALPSDRKILHVIPQDYIVDGQDGVADPVGMSGVRLEANVHIITGLVSAAKNIYRCIEKAGYEVKDIVLEPLASSYSTLHADEKEIGVALIDIGGGTTDICVFEDNTIRHTAVVAIAGNNVTHDIRKGLGVMRDQAEQLKRQFGNAMTSLIREDQHIMIPGIGGRPEKSISQSVLSQIIQPRMEELLEIVGIEIKQSGYARHLAAGVVLTGGGSLIPGLPELASEVLGLEARTGHPMGLAGGMVKEIDNPIYATAAGLVLHGLKPDGKGTRSYVQSHQDQLAHQEEFDENQQSLFGDMEEEHHTETEVTPGGNLLTRIGGRMRSWFDEL